MALHRKANKCLGEAWTNCNFSAVAFRLEQGMPRAKERKWLKTSKQRSRSKMQLELAVRQPVETGF
jgi:hypothetical protein